MTALKILLLIAFTCSLQAQSKLQWGQLDGDTEITQSTIKLERPFNTNFKAGTQSNPNPGDDYYPHAEGNAPIFNLTASSSHANAAIVNKPNGDCITSGNNEHTNQSMIVWENAPRGHLETLAISIRGGGSSFTTGSYRFLIQQADNSWAATQAFETTKKTNDSSDQVAAKMEWYHYTPITDTAATIGAKTSVNLDDIKSIGFHNQIDASDIKKYRGCEVKYFKATFSAISRAAAKTSTLISKESQSTGGSARIIADFEEDFTIDNSEPGWAYQWNPTGVEIGQRDRYQDLKQESNKSWRLVADPDKKPGAKTGPENARWLMARKGQITSGDSSEVSTDGFNHFAIVTYTIQAGEAGNISIINSKIAGKTKTSSCELRIYVNDQLLGTDITSGDSSSFNLDLGHMNEGDTFTLALGGHNKKSGGVDLKFKLSSAQ